MQLHTAAITRLEAELQRILPDARLEPVELPNTGGIKLYLIDARYSLDALDSVTQQKVMNNPLYWLFCWASGHALASWINQHPEVACHKNVLDFGSGSGVVAIASARAGATQVIASDIDPLSQMAIKVNAALNDCLDQLVIMGDVNPVATRHSPIDLCTVADVLYDTDNRAFIETLLPVAHQFLLADSRVTDFSHPALDEFLQRPGKTFPDLGGFDEFSTVRFFRNKQ